MAEQVRVPAECGSGSPARVSVVIPSYNYARFLPDAVQSALTQRDVDVDVIVVDDASTDGSADVLTRLAAVEPRIRVVRHRTNRGPVDTFNDGLAEADGEFVVRLDADDLLTPGALSRASAVCRAFPSVGLVYGHPIHFEHTMPRPRVRARTWTIWAGRRWLEDRCRSGVNVITAPEAFMRMSVIRQTGGQRDLEHTHDMEMWLRLAAYADVAYIHGADQAWHRDHAASLSRSAESPGGLTILWDRLRAFSMVFDEVSGTLPGAEDMRDLARRTLATEALQRAVYERDRHRYDPDLERELLRFALTSWPHADDLPAWRDLSRRQAWGSAWLVAHPWFNLRPALRVAQESRRRRRWALGGVYETH